MSYQAQTNLHIIAGALVAAVLSLFARGAMSSWTYGSATTCALVAYVLTLVIADLREYLAYRAFEEDMQVATATGEFSPADAPEPAQSMRLGAGLVCGGQLLLVLFASMGGGQ